MGAPLHRKVFQDKSGTRKMAGRADDLGADPAVCGHDALAVKDVLNCVLGLTFFEDGVRRNSLGEGELSSQGSDSRARQHGPFIVKRPFHVRSDRPGLRSNLLE